MASGVLVEEGVAYAAAGIANYDGTHVYALESATGKIRWQNRTSGDTAGGQGAGASVQGDLLSVGGKLYLAGGNRTPLVSYDLKDGSSQTVRPASWEPIAAARAVTICLPAATGRWPSPIGRPCIPARGQALH